MAAPSVEIPKPNDFLPVPETILDQTILSIFESAAQKYASYVAIESGRERLLYSELNNAANDLAYRIAEKLGDDKAPVAFLFQNEIHAIVTLLAIIKSGRPFVGLHPGNSLEQLTSFLEDSTALLLITTPELQPSAAAMIAGRPVDVLYVERLDTESTRPNLAHTLTPQDPLCIFYTSGSTGKPKGVLTPHLSRVYHYYYTTNRLYFSPSDRVSLVTSVCFGAAYPSLLGALLNGGTLCLFDLKANSAQAALDWIRDARLTAFRATPSIFRSVFGQAPAGLVFSNLRFITLGGEPVTGKDIALFKEHTADDCVLVDNYSSSETSAICHNYVSHSLPPFDGFLPGGYPAPGRDVLLVGEDGSEVPAGQDGEIAVRSRYMAAGYWRNPQLTAQKYHADPSEPGMQIYFTGDLGRWREDGMLEVVGRRDTQVKIRGYRVQLEAIDLVLRGLPNVNDAAVISHRPAGGERGDRLVAYVSLEGNESLSVSQLRKALAAQLPGYMIPSVFVQVASLPRTPTGKLARLQLPEPSSQRPDLETPFVEPRTEAERQCAGIWRNLLDVERVGVNDNFFDLGGDSLLALQMTLEAERVLSVNVPQSFFANPTIASLAQVSSEPFREPSEKFELEGFRAWEGRAASSSRERRVDGRRKSWGQASVRWLERVADRIIARHIVGKPYGEGRAWAVRWSGNMWARRIVYARRFAMFTRFVEELRDSRIQPRDVFELSILNNLEFGLAATLGNDWRVVRKDIEAAKRSRQPYWRDMARLIASESIERVEANFPIRGLEHLIEAQESGRGVILLTFHGVNASAHFLVLSRRLGVDEIPTISHRTPARQSEFAEETDLLPYEIASSLNTEIALYAQRRLLNGQMINVVGDSSDAHGRRYETRLAGRVYQLKAGFAELALNTGAAIIPHYGAILPDGRPQLNFEPPLDVGAGDRASQVERLVSDYVAFIERVWTAQPEVLWWTRMRRHLAQPVMGGE